MASKKTSSSESTKKTTKATTSKAKTTAKKTTTKKVAAKTTTKTSVKKPASTKKATTKKEVKKVETPVVEVKTTKEEVKPVVKKEVKERKLILNWLKENYMIVGLVLIAILLIVNIVIVTNGHKVKLSEGLEVIASLDDKEFTAEELFDELKDLYGSNALLNMVDSYIVEKELSDEEKLEAKEKAQDSVDSVREQYETYGYEWEEVLTQYGYSGEEELLEEFLLSSQKETAAISYMKENLTDKEIEKYYNEEVFGSYTAKHILIKPNTTDNMTDEEKAAKEEEAKNKAQEVINKLNEGADWATLVKEYSNDEGSVEDEGLVENFTKGDVVDEFWTGVEALEDGKYSSAPVKSSYGYHVIYRVSYTEKDKLEDMKDELVEEIVDVKLSEDANAYTEAWAAIRGKYNFTINDSIIKNAYEDSIKSE